MTKNKENKRPADRDIRWMFAYGSNLNFKQMRARCPDARPYKSVLCRGAQLVFRSVADMIEADEDSLIAGGIWQITPRCLDALDRYEGCDRHDPWSRTRGLYRRRMLKFRTKDGKLARALYYQMNHKGIAPPGDFYLNSIVQGYKDFNLDLSLLDEAVRRSYDQKEWNERLRARHEKRGQQLAKKDRLIKFRVDIPATEGE